MSVTAHRPQLETVPETEILDSSGSHDETIQEDESGSCNSETQANFDNQKVAVQSSVLLTHLWECLRKLEISENRVKKLECKRSNDMKVIVSRLLLLEGKLIKDKKRVEKIINSKDTQIQELESRLAALKHENHRIQQMMDCGDSAIGSLDYIPGVVMSTSLPLTEYESTKSRNFTDPDKRSVEGALLSSSQHQKCKRTNTDPGSRHQRRRSSQSSRRQSPTTNGGEDVVDHKSDESTNSPKCVEQATQTMPGDISLNRTVDATTSPAAAAEPECREVRSYSNPDDPESAYQKTEDKDKINDKDLLPVSDQRVDLGIDQSVPPPIPPRISMRKKSLSSPDIQKQLLSEIASQSHQVLPKSNTDNGLNDRNNNMETHWENHQLENSDFFMPITQQHGQSPEMMINYPPSPMAGKLQQRRSPLAGTNDSPTPTGHYRPPRPPKPNIPSIRLKAADKRKHLETNLDDFVIPTPINRQQLVPYINVKCADNAVFQPIQLVRRSPSPFFESSPEATDPGFSSLNVDVEETYFPRSPSPTMFNSNNLGVQTERIASPMPVSRGSSSMKQRRTGLLKKPKLYLRSYSTPNDMDYSESDRSAPVTPTQDYAQRLPPTHRENDETFTINFSQQKERTTSITYTSSATKNIVCHAAESTTHTANGKTPTLYSSKPWTYSNEDSTDDLINDVYIHFTSQNSARQQHTTAVITESAPIYF